MLTDRQKRIIIAIVEAYTESAEAEPIGSNSLKEFEGLGVSSATLRNEMAELENLGYLEKTHTSSGRIPSEKGFRLYVDELMNIEPLIEELDEQVSAVMNDTKLSKKDLAKGLIQKVIDGYKYSGVVLEKIAFNAKIKFIKFISLKHHKGIFILVTDTGLILNSEVSIPDGLNIQDIEKTVDYLSENLQNILLNDFKNAKVLEFGNDGFFDFMTNARAILEFSLRNISKLVDDKKELISQFNILSHSDFNDINKAQMYLETIKDESIYSVCEFDNGPLPALGSLETNAISVKIGSEHELNILKNCSSITAYFDTKEGIGAITIYGPMRMRYRHIIALLESIVKNMK